MCFFANSTPWMGSVVAAPFTETTYAGSTSPNVAGRITVVLFASAREAAGFGSMTRPIDGEGTSVGSLVGLLSQEFPRLAPILRVSRFVVNGEYVRGRSARVRPGDEFAVHPPYSGG
jgi:molybdopterin converting factor small subunit